MLDDMRPEKVTTKPRSDNANCKYSQSSESEKNTHVKTTRRQRKFEKISRKRGVVVNFENVT